MIEHWKPINDKYEVSDLGRVRNTRTGHISTGTNNGLQSIVSIVVNGKRKAFAIHRLVAEAFLPRTAGSDFVLHLNLNSADNRAENLYWGTREDITRIRAQLRKIRRGQS